MILGITGKIGSGKSHLIKYLQENYKTYVFSCDDIAKEMMQSGDFDQYKDTKNTIFTSKDLQENLRINFHPKVFSKIECDIKNLYHKNNFMNKNNEIEYKSTHTNINDEHCIINKNKNNFKNSYEEYEFVVIETALPNEQFIEMCDKTICIESNLNDKIKWLKDTRGYDNQKTKQIYDAQEYYQKYYDMADYKIVNDGNKEEFDRKIKEVIDEICIIGK